MIGALAALAMLGGLFHPNDKLRHDVRAQHYRVDGWRLELWDDRFTGQTTCRIERSNVVYSQGIVTFRFGHNVDTANALFRLDDGSVHTAGSVAVEAAGMGAKLSGPNLTNPSNGEVHIPADDLGDTLKVSIKPNNRMGHRVFDLTGLSHALEAAKARRCDVV